MKVPFNDFVLPYQELKAELDEAYARFMQSGWYVLGKEVEAFEQEYAAYCGRNLHRRGLAKLKIQNSQLSITPTFPLLSFTFHKLRIQHLEFRITPTFPLSDSDS